MRIVISVLAILFGLMHVTAACFGLFKGKGTAPRGSTVIMLCGGIAIVCAAIAHLTGANPGWVDGLSVAVGSILVCTAAYLNGKWAGKIHLTHHTVRISFASLLAVGLILW